MPLLGCPGRHRLLLMITEKARPVFAHVWLRPELRKELKSRSPQRFMSGIRGCGYDKYGSNLIEVTSTSKSTTCLKQGPEIPSS